MQPTSSQRETKAPAKIDAQVQHSIARWQGVALTAATGLSSSQAFVLELCALLGVPTPLPTEAHDYMFERPITFAHGDGSTSAGRMDCYRRGCFVWESKKFRNVKAGSAALNTRFSTAMLMARIQAENYARTLPPEELATGRPPFVLVADVGHVIEVCAEFTRSGASYTPFPDPRSHRIALKDGVRPEIRERLRLVWAGQTRWHWTRPAWAPASHGKSLPSWLTWAKRKTRWTLRARPPAPCGRRLLLPAGQQFGLPRR